METFLYAYIYVDQELVTKIIKENKYNIDDENDRHFICETYKELKKINISLNLYYTYDEDIDFHIIYSKYNINYIKENNDKFLIDFK